MNYRFLKNLLILSVIIVYLNLTSCDIMGSNNEVDGCLIQSGIASWYGEDYHGTQTANGEIYDMESLTAAHKRLPFNTIVGVKNLDNGENVIVRINNRGPFVEGRVIDLSREAAREIGIIATGLADVDLYLIEKGDGEISANLSCR
ncbi:MAG: septal ring lytic transglycosylase RlpA family protein [Gracilimonas sp.]|nr:septal ring lytic transglycosylase RlpA family protein [Gracilimonas sp.]